MEAEFPTSYKLLKIQVSDSASQGCVDAASLPSDWPDHTRTSRAIGDAWLKAAPSVPLEVPSAILPETSNWLLNPAHPEAREITIERAE